MRIYPPYGTDDGTPWTNGNPATGERGSVIDARSIDHSQQEIVNAIIRLGLTPDAADLEQLGKAIQNAIAASTGSAPTEDYLTLATARARLPIYPEVLTSTGRLTVTSPSSGQIIVGSAGSIRHRGIFDVAMADLSEGARTFVVLPSKTSHLRWSPSGGLQRFYLDDGAYNPSGLPETDASFDSTYDSALLARIVTDASANATITVLTNRNRLMAQTRASGAATPLGAGTLSYTSSMMLGWSRTPQIQHISGSVQADATPAGSMDHIAGWVDNIVVTRYQAQARVRTDWQSNASFSGSLGYLDFAMGA